MKSIRIEFKPRGTIYQGRHLEIRNANSQIRFYEVDRIHKKEYCLKRDTVKNLMGTSLPRTAIMTLAIRGDKSIFEPMFN